MKTNEQLVNEFMTTADEIRCTLEDINGEVRNLEGHFDPDKLTQTDINTLGKILFDLTETYSSICNMLGGRG